MPSRCLDPAIVDLPQPMVSQLCPQQKKKKKIYIYKDHHLSNDNQV